MNKLLLEKLSEITQEERIILDGGVIDKTIYTDDEDFTVKSSKMLGFQRFIEMRPHTRFANFPKHKHNYIEMIYMCSGSTRHLINDREVLLSRGELLILNQSATQEIYPAGEEDVAVNFIILLCALSPKACLSKACERTPYAS